VNTTETRHQSPNTPAPEDGEDHEEHPPRLDISARNLAGFAVFVVLAYAQPTDPATAPVSERTWAAWTDVAKCRDGIAASGFPPRKP